MAGNNKDRNKLLKLLLICQICYFLIKAEAKCRLKEYTIDKINQEDVILQSEQFFWGNFTYPTELDLAYCRIKKIEQGAFSGGELLVVDLNLYLNQIEILDPDVFKDLQSLATLTIAGNPLKRLQGKGFPNLPNLTNLHMYNCGFTHVQQNLFTNLKKLRYLTLSNNKLKFLDWKVFSGLNNLKYLRLQGNPWHCNCSVKFLLDFFEENKISLTYGGKAPTCKTSPGDIFPTNLEWFYLDKDKFICPAKIDNFRTHENQEINPSQSLHFECEYSGYPQPEVRWFRDNKEIKSGQPGVVIKSKEIFIEESFKTDKNTSRVNTEFLQTLLIEEFVDDSGIYKCVVSNKGGNASAWKAIGKNEDFEYSTTTDANNFLFISSDLQVEETKTDSQFDENTIFSSTTVLNTESSLSFESTLTFEIPTEDQLRKQNSLNLSKNKREFCLRRDQSVTYGNNKENDKFISTGFNKEFWTTKTPSGKIITRVDNEDLNSVSHKTWWEAIPLELSALLFVIGVLLILLVCLPALTIFCLKKSLRKNRRILRQIQATIPFRNRESCYSEGNAEIELIKILKNPDMNYGF